MPLPEACERLPAYWFPIVSPADLKAKLADLAATAPRPSEQKDHAGEPVRTAPGDCWA
jgi:hypothetical protein